VLFLRELVYNEIVMIDLVIVWADVGWYTKFFSVDLSIHSLATCRTNSSSFGGDIGRLEEALYSRAAKFGPRTGF